MKKKKAIFTVLLLAFASLAFGQVPDNAYTVEQLVDGTLMITQFYLPASNPNVETLTIPSQLFGVRVSRIGDSVFSGFGKSAYINLPNLTRIIIPDTITVIGNSAFDYFWSGTFKNLREIRIPRSVTTIGNSAFMLSSGRLKVVIPSSVRSLGYSSFTCHDITEIVIESVIPEITTYSSNSTVFNSGKLEKITFPANWNNDQTLDRLGLPTSFVNYYKSQGRRGGVYVKNGQIWTFNSSAPASEPYGGIFRLPDPPSAAPTQTPVPANMVRINGGKFIMGSPLNEPENGGSESPQHEVTVSSFYMGKYEVTQKEYREVMGINTSRFKGDNLPVENVTWFDAVEYCNKRGQKEGLTPAYTISGRTPATGYSISAATVTWNRNANGYRLPTEAEWEYACRAGTTTAYNTGANISDNTGWYDANSSKTTHPVGQKSANAWGLYDMHGNVWEWCWDLPVRYSRGVVWTNPAGADLGTSRVIRGGGWGETAQFVRSAKRWNVNPSFQSYMTGFRLVRNDQ